ncbi:MAG: regulatory iron-sulfur-containing complex subunit RicT [Termitinemataceae bacterium]|nr:MAG: regulatory iron-sulfur-containing complex subunit RicT [Termitinemataceae bacterium]
MNEDENTLNDDYVETEDSGIENVTDYEIDGSEVTVDAGDAQVSAEQISGSSVVYQLHLDYSCENIFGVWSDAGLTKGTNVLLNTRYGKDMVNVVGIVNSKTQLLRVYKIERIATEKDIEQVEENIAKEKSAFDICKTKIQEHKLDMKLVNVHYLFENSKILFFFTAESRVDFRELVKDLVVIFKTRIELRQIGIRDETRVLGGLGICGRKFCCNSFSEKLKPVSIKMAKDQNLSLSSMKISGCCGRLLCCLDYEHDFYAEQRHIIPPEGTKIMWNNVLWKVTEVNIILGTVRLSTEDGRITQLNKTCFEKKENVWTINNTASERIK